ncbi:MAG: DUF2283 domain-containing protein [Sulfolobales archaeon]|nr:DUF2283 domain-containing protein [Sulfolobales archaeon]MCX8199302.1 DUF2283 domain-containing protein [Sulfolobales archaeon]MDW8170384.1 DUF2283 domain-containing protein [Desulfurococcaceae archaeon]
MNSCGNQCDYKVGDLDKLWLEYDRQNDVLYINFGYESEEADEEVLVGDDVVIRIKNKKIVSITIMNFSSKANVVIM